MGILNKLWRLAAILIFLALIVPAVQSLEFGDIASISADEWMTAGDTATIEVIKTNSSVSIQNVEFLLLGTGSSGTLSTAVDSSAPYKTDFYSEESGTANIQVDVNYIFSGSVYSISRIYGQKVDHDSMYQLVKPDVQGNYEVTVNEVAPILVYGLDKYGNRIDSRKEDDEGGVPEYFLMESSPVTSEFWDGSGFNDNTVTAYVNSSGYAPVLFRVSEIAGTNIINAESSDGVYSKSATIIGIADAEPAELFVSVSPHSGDPPYTHADGISYFEITYTLYDQWGNPSAERDLYIEPSDSSDPAATLTTNSQGQINITYGPKSIKGIYTLDASCVDDMSITSSTDLSFISTDPTDMYLTANPQVMASHDVDPTLKSQMRAKVVDEMGNPVDNETVEFSLIDGTYPVYQVSAPYLESASAVSDQDGYAIVNFIPGEFETDWSSPNFSKMAEASCQVMATWEGQSDIIDLDWKNYPYLSVYTNVSPPTAAVNDTIEVTVQLVGDGWALQPDPIDVMMVSDRSGSMLWDYPDRMVSLMEAMKLFNAEMNEDRDRIGLTTFGGATGTPYIWYYWTNDLGYDNLSSDNKEYLLDHYIGNGVTYYADYATVDQVLTDDHEDFDREVDYIVPKSGTPLRFGLYTGIMHMCNFSRNDVVKAVVALTDGDWNTGGDPLAASGSWEYYYDLAPDQQSMSAFANANGIKIYTIAFGEDLTPTGLETLDLLAQETGGKSYIAPDGDKLKEIYKEIAGELLTAAGVNTEMDLMFQDVEINNVTVSNEGEDPALTYVYDPASSTIIENFYDNGTHTLEIEDQSEWWDANTSLHFDVGTVYLNQTWQTKFKLKMLKPGNINIFNDTSTITFNGGEETLALPDTYVTVVPELNSTGTGGVDVVLDVYDFILAEYDSANDKVVLSWYLDYTGEYSASQKLEYINLDEGVYTEFGSMPSVSGPVSTSQQYEWDVYSLPRGEYNVRLTASAPDKDDDVEYLSSTINIGSSEGAYIKIE